jgi:hypothetical protein
MLNRKPGGQRAGGSTRRSVSGAGFWRRGAAADGLAQASKPGVRLLPPW